MIAAADHARAQATATLTTLYNFSDSTAPTYTNSDGSNPYGNLVEGSDGNFYGTTHSGGANDTGTVFRITPDGSFTTLYTFQGYDPTNGIDPDGANPQCTLIQGQDGNLYGTTNAGGGVADWGTVFSVTTSGVEQVVVSFVGDNGRNPTAGLIQGANGLFYGTTSGGGPNGQGEIFSLASAGTLSDLHDFGATTGTIFGGGSSEPTNDDGIQPMASLVQDKYGNFYGTAYFGGVNGSGTVFMLSAQGIFTVLHTFGAIDGNYANTDGVFPGALLSAPDGSIYGVTQLGGTSGYGTIFKVAPDGTFSTFYTFSGTDYGAPPSSLVVGSDGNFYGTTLNGGVHGWGSIFQLTPDGQLTTVYSFSGPDGYGSSFLGLIQGSDGNFYGVTFAGGATFDILGNGYVENGANGTVFKLIVSPTITSAKAASGTVGQAFSYQLNASFNPSSLSASGLPAGLSFDASTGLISGSPTQAGSFSVTLSAANAGGTGTATLSLIVQPASGSVPPPFFTGEVALANGVYYLSFPNGNYFGYYSYLTNPAYLYHFDLGYEYLFDANDGQDGLYLYDFASGTFFYTSPSFPFPYLYDFTLNATLYYYPDTTNPGHYTSHPRSFFDFATGQIITE